MDQLIQIVGALLILAAFAAVQFDRMRPDSRLYLALNLVGSAILAVLAVAAAQWGFVLLEGVWAIVSAWGLVSIYSLPDGERINRQALSPRSPRAARRVVSSRARAPPRRRPSQSVGAVRGPLDPGVAQRRDVLEGEQVLAPFDQRARAVSGAARGSRCRGSPPASRARCSSSAAVFGPTPLAPGSPSEGSPRRAMKSGTSSGVDAVALAHLLRARPLRRLCRRRFGRRGRSRRRRRTGTCRGRRSAAAPGRRPRPRAWRRSRAGRRPRGRRRPPPSSRRPRRTRGASANWCGSSSGIASSRSAW